MSKGSIPRYVCDRCGTIEEIRVAHQEHVWGGIQAGEINGAFQIGSRAKNREADICPSCTKELEAWWAEKKDKGQ